MPLFKPIQAAHTSDVWKLEFSPRGDRFATASSDATSMVIEYPRGRIVGPAFVGAGGINAVAFTPNGRLLGGGGAGGAEHRWDRERGRKGDRSGERRVGKGYVSEGRARGGGE